MITGMKMVRRVWCGLLLLLPFVVEAETFTLPQLMQRLAQVEQHSISYREQQYLSILDMPLESSGTLSFRAPDVLEKRVDNGGGSYRVQGRQLEVEHDGEPRTLSLQSYPVLAAFVAAFRATLNGDQQTLERYYRVELQGELDDWQLSLRPTQSEMSRVLRAIHFYGNSERIRVIETLEQGGDHSRMELGDEGEN